MTDYRLVSLLSSRKNSKFLAKFLCDYNERTDRAPLSVVFHADDTWNQSLIKLFYDLNGGGRRGWEFTDEDLGMGRGGLHVYLRLALESWINADPTRSYEWAAYFCEDHNVVMPGWDQCVLSHVDSLGLNPDEPHILVPRWDNTGAMSHILSRGFIKAMGSRLASHGNMDSYLNDIADKLPRGHVHMLPVMFHDFTHDRPHMLDDAHTRVEVTRDWPPYQSDTVQGRIAEDVADVSAVIRILRG